jgi:hypothetical protein
MLLTTVLFALIGFIAGYPLARIAAQRSSRMPVDYNFEYESDFLAWIIQQPENIVRVLDVEDQYFAYMEHVALWGAIKDRCKSLPRLPDDASEEDIASASLGIPENLIDSLSLDFKSLILTLQSRVLADGVGMEAAGYVFYTGKDRLLYPGTSPIERGGLGEPPLLRRYAPPSNFRYLMTSIFTSAGAAVTPLLAYSLWPSGPAYLLSIAALTTLTVGSVLWALVDYDTMLLDNISFYIFAGLAWLLTLAADIVGGEPIRAVQGFTLSFAIAVLFIVMNYLYKLIRKMDGMGSGDSFLVVATAGVPSGLAGQLNLWYLCAMGGMVVAILAFLFRYPTRYRISKETPFAFGPYLALGWIIGSAAHLMGLNIW